MMSHFDKDPGKVTKVYFTGNALNSILINLLVQHITNSSRCLHENNYQNILVALHVLAILSNCERY